MTRTFTVVIQREGDMYVAFSPELDIASQGTNVQEARENLREAIELVFEHADPAEIEGRTHGEQYVSSVDIVIG
jgi:predicted RNase H-like HicB family nuclease